MSEAKHYRWEDIEPEALNPLIDRQFVVGTGTMVARLLLKKGARVPRLGPTLPAWSRQVSFGYECSS